MEAGVSFINSPSILGGNLDSDSGVSTGWLAMDVTGAVGGNGVANLGLKASSIDTLIATSRDTASKSLELVMRTAP